MKITIIVYKTVHLQMNSLSNQFVCIPALLSECLHDRLSVGLINVKCDSCTRA